MKRDAELLIGKLMLTCILISMTILVYGAILYFVQHGHGLIQDQTFSAEPQQLIVFKTIWQGALANDSESILMLGLLFVIAGQVLRVFLTMILFGIQRDIKFVVLSLAVFVTLICHAF